jgi:hypothetical protein
MEDIEDYRLEIILLQEKDTRMAKESGHKTKQDWYNHIINSEADEIAIAIIDISERYNIPVETVASHFDSSMVMRVGKILSEDKYKTKAA